MGTGGWCYHCFQIKAHSLLVPHGILSPMWRQGPHMAVYMEAFFFYKCRLKKWLHRRIHRRIHRLHRRKHLWTVMAFRLANGAFLPQEVSDQRIKLTLAQSMENHCYQEARHHGGEECGSAVRQRGWALVLPLASQQVCSSCFLHMEPSFLTFEAVTAVFS